MSIQKALITGASGFTGQHLVRFLNSRGIATFPLRVRGTQVADRKFIAGILAKTDPDCVFHLAGIADSESADEILRVNVLYAITLLDALKKSGLSDRPLLLVGTAAEYGQISAQEVPVTEDTPCRPYNAYGRTKLAQTMIGLTAAQSDNRPIVIARPFNIIGNGMPGYLALESFRRQIQRIKTNEQPPVIRVGNLEPSRDFIDVEDVVRLYWRLIQNPSAVGQVVNLCSGIGTPIGTLLRELIAASGLSIDIQSDPARIKPIDVPVHYGSNKKLHTLIGDFRYTPLAHTIQKIAI